MHGQGNYNKQAVQGTHLPPPPPFHENPAASSVPLPPPPFHHGSLPPQRPGIQQGHGSYQLPPGGNFAYSHAPPPGALQHGSPALSGIISGSSYFTAPPPPQVRGNNPTSHSYTTSGAPWSQNVSQYPQKVPPPAAGTYPLPDSQGNITEKGSSHQNPSQRLAPPRFPPYSSSLPTSDPYSSSILAHAQPNFPPLGPLPPPPPPPLPTHSPPGVPPLPTSSPPSYNIPNNAGGHSSMEDAAYGDNLVLDSTGPTTCAGGSSVLDRNEMEVKAEDAGVAHSPDDSDMDMEDDMTQSDEEKQKNLSTGLHDECISMSKELDKKEHLRDFPHSEGNKVPNCAEDGYLISARSSVSKDQILGAEIRSGCDTSVDGKLCSEADKLTVDVETKNLMVVIKESPPRFEKFSQPTVAVASVENGTMEPSSELKESTDAFKMLEGYATDSSTDSGEHLGDVTPPTSKVESTYSDVRDECNFGSESRLENTSEPDKVGLARAVTKSPKKMMRADKSSSAARKVEKLADNRPRSKKIAPAECGKSDSARLDVDEFGRLVRKGVSDSDTSDSPRHTRKRERRDRWRSRSRSTSVSPSDRRRRRRDRRGRSRSFSPRRRRSRTRSPVLRRRSRTRSPVLRRRSRTRSPVLRRGSDMFGDKNRRDKGQVVGCFDFLKGKCYRGANCRFSHNEPYKDDRVRYNSGKHQHEETPATSNSDFHLEKESRALKRSVHENISVNDEGAEFPKYMPSLKEVKEVPADSTMESHDKLTTGETASLYTENVTPGNLSGYLSPYMTGGNESSYIQTYPAQYPDKVPQINPELEKVDKGTESSTQASSATLTHLPTLKPDREQAPIGQASSVGSPMKKSHTTEGVLSQLNVPWTAAPQDMNVPVAQPIFQDYSSTAPSAPFHQKPESYQPYPAPMSYQNPHFGLPFNPLFSQVVLPPPPPRPPSTNNVSTVEHSIPSLNMHHYSSSHTHLRPYPTGYSSQPQNGQYQAFPSAPGHDQIPRAVNDFTSRSFHTSNVSTQQGIRQTVGEDNFSGQPMQGSIHSLAVAQSQYNSRYGSAGVNVPSNTSASQSLPYFQPTSYGLHYPSVSGASMLGEPGNLSSSVSRVAGNFLEMGPQSHLHDVLGSKISNHFNPYASTFDQPISTKFSTTAPPQENAKQFTPMYGTSVGLSTVSVDANKIEIDASKHLIPSSSSVIAAEALTTRPGNNQYDPLCDSIEQPSISLTGASLPNNEIIGDSDNFQRSSGSSKVLSNKNVKQEGGVGISADDSLDFEEYEEMADNIEVGDVVNGSPSTPNNAMEIHAGEIEIDQVKGSSKKKGKDSRSTNLFKTSIASFVKEVLKPSWRQGNMSKEAFKTIVKKTVDKVSGAMKSHKIPRSQAKINQYIDSSRGKLTKLVMGYVDKYVKM